MHKLAKHIVVRWAHLLGLLLMTGCASVPAVHEVIDQAPTGPQKIVGPRGPLSSAQSKAVLAKLDQQSKGSDILQRHLAIEQSLADAPLIAGNRTTILRDGPATFHAMFDAIKKAKHSVYLEYYTFENVESDDLKLADLLLAERQAGIAVAVLYDSYGSIDTPVDFFDRLRFGGVAVLEFHPLNPLKAATGYAPNDRDHRKILAVDGAVAVVGGVNLYTAYQRHPHARSVKSDGGDPETWHDTDLKIEGPAAKPLQQLFLDHWAAEEGRALPPPVATPALAGAGNELVRIIGSDHDATVPRYYATVLSAIRNAEKSIWLTTAYFVPTDDEVDDLIAAAKRGVDVRLMLPGISDSDMALRVAHSNYGRLLKAGIKIYELQDGVLHSKSAVIDGVWSVVGSSNFDHRSILFNDEVDAVVLGRDTAKQLEDLFVKDETESRPVTLAEWEDRPLSEKLRELYARSVESFL